MGRCATAFAILLLEGSLAVANAGSNAISDAVAPAAPGEVRLLGRPGELFQASLNARVFSEQAKGPVYDEAENAFATHWDDSDGHTGWQNEYWGKTMLCYAGAVRYTCDAKLAEWCVAKAHHLIDAYQWPNGYLSTYANEDLLRKNPESSDYEQHWCFNIWGQKYTLWALIELNRATGDEKCLRAAEKMADHLVAQLKRLNVTIDKTGSWAGISSMTILRPLLELYRIVPKREYLELAESIVKATDVSEGAKPDVNLIYDALSDRPVVTWFRKPMHLSKAYELLSFFEGVADYHRLTGNARALKATEAFWGHLFAEELNPMRSAGYFDHFLYAKRHVNGMTELCDVTHWIRLNRELWKLTGETKYLDCIEEAFYNAFLAGVSPDGAWGAHIVRSHGSRHLAAPAQTGMKLHQCCPDNMLRTFYDWADTVADVASDGAWEVNLYSDADVSLPGAKIELRGNYPVSETFRLRIVAERPDRLRLRVPHWAGAISVDGNKLSPKAGRVELDVQVGERTFDLAFAMPPRLLYSEAPESEDIDTVTDLDTQKPEGYTKRFMSWYTPEMKGLERRTPAAQVMRGPLVLAKGRAAGTSREETFDAKTLNRQQGVRLSLAPAKRVAANIGVWGAWELTIEKPNSGKDVERNTVPVADYWSVSCMDDPANWFSLWF
ncbi:MAG: glycoside hydrolase family 127 protein [Kiritimatiellae bacterium]|nr:glycoside hydrolase family 127 protein [Kiritimatiellia bacterium]